MSINFSRDLLARVERTFQAQDELRQGALNLIASQNLMSPAARAALGNAFADKIAAGAIGQRNHIGARAADALEATLLEAARHLYGTAHVEYRLMSGALANQIAVMAAIPRGSTILVIPRAASGDPTVRERGYPRWAGATIVDLPWDYASHNVDLDGLRAALRQHHPAWIVVGGSRPLFPYSISEMRKEAVAYDCRIFYDGAHILGLWAGGQFQDPLADGADMVTGSTQKTLPGPVGGLLLTRDADIARSVSTLCDEVLSNYSNARVASLAVTLCEMIAFGQEYAQQVVANARALGRALAAEGFVVVAAERGFTDSHQVLLTTRGCRVADVRAVLEAGTVLCTPVPLLLDAGRVPEPGLRLGTAEVTRRGMGPDEMVSIARIFRRLLLDGDSPERVAGAARELMTRFTAVRYTFSTTDGKAGRA